jgi:hypothetical protein
MAGEHIAPARVVERVLTHGQLLGSVDTHRELMETLLSPKFDRYLPRTRGEALLDRLAPNVAIIGIVQQVPSAATPTTIGFLVGGEPRGRRHRHG